MQHFLYTSIICPLNQFDLRDLFSLNAPLLGNLYISLTNIGLYLSVGALSLNVLGAIHIIRNQINPAKGQIYFPFIYTLFILVNNLIGMVPYSFASTSPFIFTFSLSFTVVLGAIILGFQKHDLELLSNHIQTLLNIGYNSLE